MKPVPTLPLPVTVERFWKALLGRRRTDERARAGGRLWWYRVEECVECNHIREGERARRVGPAGRT